jgi:hypothetical protein
VFANDITITGRSEEDKKSFTGIKTPADAMVIKANKEKTKYTIITGNRKQTMVKQYNVIWNTNLTEYGDLHAWVNS